MGGNSVNWKHYSKSRSTERKNLNLFLINVVTLFASFWHNTFLYKFVNDFWNNKSLNCRTGNNLQHKITFQALTWTIWVTFNQYLKKNQITLIINNRTSVSDYFLLIETSDRNDYYLRDVRKICKNISEFNDVKVVGIDPLLHPSQLLFILFWILSIIYESRSCGSELIHA